MKVTTDLTARQARRLEMAVERGWLRSTLMDLARDLTEHGSTFWIENTDRRVPTALAFLRSLTDEPVDVIRKDEWVCFTIRRTR